MFVVELAPWLGLDQGAGIGFLSPSEKEFREETDKGEEGSKIHLKQKCTLSEECGEAEENELQSTRFMLLFHTT